MGQIKGLEGCKPLWSTSTCLSAAILFWITCSISNLLDSFPVHWVTSVMPGKCVNSISPSTPFGKLNLNTVTITERLTG